MNYFKNENNEVFAYDDEQVEDDALKETIDNLEKITEVEKDELLAPTMEEQIKINEEDAKTERDNAEVSNIEVHDAEWQVKDVDRNRIKETIDTAYRQNRAEETINWILADNTIRESTVKDLEDVLDAFSLRREDIFTQYAIWRNGDKTTSFVYEN